MLLYNQDQEPVKDIPGILYRGFDTLYKDSTTPIIQQVRRIFEDKKIYSKALLFKEKQIKVQDQKEESIVQNTNEYNDKQEAKKLKKYLTMLEAKKFNPSMIRHNLLVDHVSMEPTPFACTSDSLTVAAYYSHWIIDNPIYNPILIIEPKGLQGIDMRRETIQTHPSNDREIAIFHSIPVQNIKGLIVHETKNLEDIRKLVGEVHLPLKIFKGRLQEASKHVEKEFNRIERWYEIKENIKIEEISF